MSERGASGGGVRGALGRGVLGAVLGTLNPKP